MKRDMDLVREILLAIEGDFLSFAGTSLEGRFEATPAIVAEHVRLIEQAGLIEVQRRTLAGAVYVRGLTWAGYDFLDAIRDPEVWKRTKEGASKVGGWSFDLLKDIATAYLKSEAKARLGLDL